MYWLILLFELSGGNTIVTLGVWEVANFFYRIGKAVTSF